MLEPAVQHEPLLRLHPELPGDALRGDVLGPDQADQAGPPEDVEGIIAAGGGGLRGEPPAPVRAVDQVADVRLVGPRDPPRARRRLSPGTRLAQIPAQTTPMFHRCCHSNTDVPSMPSDRGR